MTNGVLFLCTNNACRSQMAEALLRKRAGTRFKAFSAGLRPTVIHPFTYRVMAEAGIDLSDHHSKGVKEYFRESSIGVAIIVCELVEPDCPKLFPGVMQTLRWPFPDPAQAVGSEVEALATFRRVRDQIDERIQAWLEEGS